jgi:hypothetical protein
MKLSHVFKVFYLENDFVVANFSRNKYQRKFCGVYGTLFFYFKNSLQTPHYISTINVHKTEIQ